VRLVSEISYSVARFALINPGDSVVRAWKVTSKTRLSGIAAAPTLVDGVPVVPLDVSNGRRWEKLIVRLDGSLRLRLADRPIIGEVNLFTPLRTTVEGDVYQLRTSMTGGASVARYSIR
jgi:hypothetical protein